MRKWTTPSFKCTIPSDVQFDYIIVTFQQNCHKLEKTILPSEVEEGIFYLNFTQEESAMFETGNVEVECNFMLGDVRMASGLETIYVKKNLHDELIGESEETTLIIEKNGKYNMLGYDYVDVNVQAKTEEVLLWENANPDEPMNSNELRKLDYSYDYFKINFKHKDGGTSDVMLSVHSIVDGYEGSTLYDNAFVALFDKEIMRQLVYTVRGGVPCFIIADAYNMSTFDEEPLGAVPLYIYGVNL